MPSLTPLHETYCKWDRTPPSQADLLEGVAQVVSTPLNHVARELIQTIQAHEPNEHTPQAPQTNDPADSNKTDD